MDEKLSNEWAEVEKSLNSLGLKLKLHAEQALSEDRERIDSALHDLRHTIEGAFEALHGAVTDQAVRDDLKNVAGGVAHAVSSTLSGVGREVRDRTKVDKS
jgi:hypothetical protein